MGKLIIEHLVKKFEDVTAVDHVSLTVEDGELLTVVGPSGCGKTTLLRMIAGFAEPTYGSIRIDDDLLFDHEKRKKSVPPEGRDIGMVFQTYAVWPHMNVYDNVAYPLKLRKMSRAKIREEVERVLKLVHLTGYEKRMAFEMSGGQQQRVALARALVVKPRLLLLDEPFSNLDAVLREAMSEEVREIQRKTKTTVIHVTHDQAEAMAMSDKIAVMKDGHLIQLDTPENVYEHPASTFVAGFIGSANILPAELENDGKPDREGKMQVRTAKGDLLSIPCVRVKEKKGFVVFRAQNLMQDPSSSMRAVVKGCRYMGTGNRYQLRYDDGITFRMKTKASEQYEIGEEIPIAVRDAIWLEE